jgi:acyl-CoA thioester hydrolase
VYETRIFYQDTDAGGVVYFANYLRFFEKSWFEFLASIGIPLPYWETRDTFLMVKTVLLDLKGRLAYGDYIHVVTSIKAVKKASFVLLHKIYRGEDLTTTGETEMVCVDGTGRLRRLPAELHEPLLAYVKQWAAERP